MDRLLDGARSGPLFLRQPEVAQVVFASLQYGSAIRHYELHAWVIMPNHVHLLLTPLVCPSKLPGILKAEMARRSSVLLHRTGKAFWQDESYDRLVRNGEEFRRIEGYITNNPVKACLVSQPQAYLWSSAGRPTRPPQYPVLPH
jgi:putative DNA methylase